MYRTASPRVATEQVWLIYRMWDVNGRLLYIGQTGRAAVVRWLEHIEEKWWAGEIATMQRQTLTYSSLAEVKAAEELAIETEQPLHNIEHNWGNPNRIIAPPHGVNVRRRGGRPVRAVQPGAPVMPVWWSSVPTLLAIATAVWSGVAGMLLLMFPRPVAVILWSAAFWLTVRGTRGMKRRRRRW